LADKILQSKSALEGERKQVTVLFADVKGSMELAEQVDAEEWHKILDRFFQILTDGVHRFEGTVNQYTGDGIMALFGAPIAHEDHAQRACYAALALTEELRRYANELRLQKGLNFSVRMGLNSGEVIVGKIGDDLRMDYTAQGHTVGLAARMEQIAEAGRVYLTEHTATLVQGFVELGDLGRLEVKGSHEPLRVYELRGQGQLRTRMDVSRARGFSRFVGRADEMHVLDAALTSAEEGNARIVGVVGEAGIGKSRLCYEVLERCRARSIMTYEARGVAHGKAIPFLPILQLFRVFYGITEQDSEVTAREKIAGRMLLLDERFRESLPLLFDFLGVSDPEHPSPRMDPDARQRQLFAVVRGVIHARAQRETTVTLLEDLHWFDAGSEAFLEPLIDAPPGTRGLVIVNFRPEYQADWMHKSSYQQLPLPPLGAEAIRQLLHDLLGTDASIGRLAEVIQARTAGNPFFTEEVVQSLVESGRLEGSKGGYRLVTPVEDIEIPNTVQSILAARIDRLAEREKQVLQTAAVIGREFAEPVLAAVIALPAAELAEALRTLKAAEFLYDQALYPVAEYVFKHPLTQEVAYRSQLSERRARVHGAVARTITKLYADCLDEQAALIAHHWEAAEEALEAARWHGRAAQWAGMTHLAEALHHWRPVRELLERIPESAETMHLGCAARMAILNVAWRLGGSEEEAAGTFAEGKALAERIGDPRLLAQLLSAYAAVIGLCGDVQGYVNYGTEAARVADQSDDVGLKAACRVNVFAPLLFGGRLRDSLQVSEQGLALTAEDPRLGADAFGYSPYIFLVGNRGGALAAMGRFAEAAASLDRAAQLARQHGEAEILGFFHAIYVELAWLSGQEPQAALGHARHAVEIAEKGGSPLSRAIAYLWLGQAYLMTKDWSQAAGALEQGLRIASETRAGLAYEGLMLALLARAYLELGENGRARETVDEAIAVARRRGTRFYECVAHITRAHVLLQTEGAQASGEIEAALKEAQALVEETGGRSQEPFIHEALAELARLIGNQATCQRERREAHRLFVALGATGHAERLVRELEAGG
jgi:class 3 adenylate cyclase/tetratricopeptide (TPR) repeat protein